MLDGELVAFGDHGKPDLERVCMRTHRHADPLVFIAFDVLSVEGDDVRREPDRQRRRMLEALPVHGPQWKTPESFDDGEPCRRLFASKSSMASASGGMSRTSPASGHG